MLPRNRLFNEKKYIVAPTLADRFTVPPISLLDSRQGEWQKRKRRWATVINWRTDQTRKNVDNPYSTSGRIDLLDPTSQRMASINGDGEQASMFDPVLAEISYSWWCPLGGLIADPFAGGNVRGMVAGHSGYRYHGVDLSADQVETNRYALDTGPVPPIRRPQWAVGDASAYDWGDIQADFVFSCPPYGTLERYSEDPNDLSTMKIDQFRAPYKKAVQNVVNALKDNRFAAFVVGNYRENKKLVDLVSLTVEAFGEAGADYYGDLLYVTPYGTAPLRAATTFNGARKVVRTHQYLLSFIKGDPFTATKEIQNAEI